MKHHYRNKDCIVVFILRKGAGSGIYEVWIRHNELESIWEDFKPDVTDAEKKKMSIQMKPGR